MVDTIGPMVGASGKRSHDVELAHVAGGVLGGAVTGFAAGAVGALVGFDDATPWWLVASMAPAALVALAVDALREGRKLGPARQTPSIWRHVLPARAAAFLNGFDLGLGWTTRIYFLSYVVALLAAVVSAHAVAGAIVGASFGVGRALLVVFARRRANGSLSIDSLAAQRPRVVALNSAALVQFAWVAGLAASSRV